MGTKREVFTLTLASIGALAGLTSLSMIVWERIEDRPRVVIDYLSMREIRFDNGPAKFYASVVYKNPGKREMVVLGPPLLIVREAGGRQFGPYLMRLPSGKLFNERINLAARESEYRDYQVPAFERAIANGEIPEFRNQWRDFTFEIETSKISYENPLEEGVSIIRKSFVGSSFDGKCGGDEIWCSGNTGTDDS